MLSDVGEQSFVVKVTDSTGASAAANFTITIAASEGDIGTDDTGKTSSGGSVFHLGLLLACLYRRRSYLSA